MSKDLLAVPVLIAGIFLAWECRRSARVALGTWWAAMCFVPYWLEVRLVFEWPPQALIGLALIPAVMRYGRRLTLKVGDWAVVAIVLLMLAALAVGDANKAPTEQMIVQGGLGYLVGRCLVPAAGKAWFGKVLCGTVPILAAWGALEYFAGVHLFEHLATGPEGSWAALQYRGGHIRSDAAFGDPIVLGAFLAYCVPYVTAARLSLPPKLVLLALAGFGIFTSDSRAPFISAGLGVILILCFSRALSSHARTSLALACICVAVPVYAASSLLFAQSNATGQTQLQESTSYRVDLYSDFLKDIRPLGLARNVAVDSATGSIHWRDFGSIDSSLIYLSLNFGWLAVLVPTLCVIALACRSLIWRASVGQLALLAQLPVLLTVAPITQYRTLMLFAGGIAVSWHSDRATDVSRVPKEQMAVVRAPRELATSQA